MNPQMLRNLIHLSRQLLPQVPLQAHLAHQAQQGAYVPLASHHLEKEVSQTSGLLYNTSLFT